MDLREYVKETLCQIIQGVKDAQDATADSGAVISPTWGLFRSGDSKRDPVAVDGAGPLQFVEFDVVVGKEGSSENKGGLGVWFGSVGLGGQAKTAAQESAVNRIRFSVPVAFPQYRPKSG